MTTSRKQAANVTKLYYEEDQVEEFSALIHACAAEHSAPNFAIDLAGHGVRQVPGPMGTAYVLNASGLAMMAERWRENEFEPADFADRIGRLADAVAK